MATVTKTQTQDILNHHVSAFVDADLDAVLEDFTEESELLTPEGALKGLDSIRSFFSEIFKIIPKGSTLDLKQLLIRDNLAYVVWSCDSIYVNVPIGTDTFIMKGDKILYQSLAAQIVPK